MIAFSGNVEHLLTHTLCGEHYSGLFAPHYPPCALEKPHIPSKLLWKLVEIQQN